MKKSPTAEENAVSITPDTFQTSLRTIKHRIHQLDLDRNVGAITKLRQLAKSRLAEEAAYNNRAEVKSGMQPRKNLYFRPEELLKIADELEAQWPPI